MKNKILISLILMIVTPAVFAHEYSFYANAPTGQRIYYKINGNNVTVCCPGSLLPFSPWGGYSKPIGNLTIPSSVTYNGTTYTVTEIGQNAFWTCNGLTSVIIPNTVTSIKNQAFYECTGLTLVNIGDAVHDIAVESFAFCSSLTSLIIPNSVVFIGPRAFEFCDGLVSLSFGNSVGVISTLAFRDCTSLASIYIPGSVQSIASDAFRSCSGLFSIVVSNDNSYYDSRNDCNAIIRTSTNNLVTGCRNTIIPNTVISIGPYAFYECTSLHFLDIPNSVTTIHNAAFWGCSGLNSITLPDSLGYIGYASFYECIGLTSISSRAIVAPSFSVSCNDAFEGVPQSIPIYIPCGSAESYASGWNCFSNRNETLGFSINVASDNHAMGYAQILSGPNCSDSIVTILATAYNGYHFTNWSDGNTDNPRQIVVTQDFELMAYFVIDTFSIIVVSSDSLQGHVEGGGEFVYRTTCTIKATADSGYHFDHWSTEVTDNPYSFLVTSDTTITAYFEADGENEGLEVNNIDIIKIFSQGGRIIVEGTAAEVHVFDMIGRSVRNESLPAGVYMVKIGNHPARKVVVIK